MKTLFFRPQAFYKLLSFLLLMGIYQTPLVTWAQSNFPNSVTVAGETLIKNGQGTRVRLMFKVYNAALYLPQKETNPHTVINSKVKKRMALQMLRDVDAQTFSEALKSGLSDNVSTEELKEIAAASQQFENVIKKIGKIHNKDEIHLDFSDDQLHIFLNQKNIGTIQSAKFLSALLSIWLGENPVDNNLKKGLVGMAT